MAGIARCRSPAIALGRDDWLLIGNGTGIVMDSADKSIAIGCLPL